MSIFNSYVSLPEGIPIGYQTWQWNIPNYYMAFTRDSSIAIGCSVPTMITKGPPVNFLNICKLSNYHTHHLSIIFLALPMV